MLENIAADGRVSFCVVGTTEVFDEEKQLALEGLLARYSAEYFLEGLNYIKAKGGRTRVFRIGIDSISGKARR